MKSTILSLQSGPTPAVTEKISHMQPLLQDYRFYDVFSVVFKISNGCNLHCDYCYRENAPKIDTPKQMPLQVIEKTLGSILFYKYWLYNRYGWSKRPSINFIWHGGEPLSVGINQINKILEIQKKYESAGLVINNSIQTNGTLLNKYFIEIFKKEQFQLGVSIDGPLEVHNQHRVYSNGTPSFEATYKGIQLLKSSGYPWSAISVITEESMGKEEMIFDFFMKERPYEVDFTPAFFYETEISLTPESYAQFMIQMFDLWASEEKPPFEIRFFKDVLYLLGFQKKKKNSIICELSGQCHRNISVATNGDLYSCECLNSKPTNKIGNLLNNTFWDIVNSEKFIHLSQNTNTYRKECLSCDVFFVCKAGCYNRRLPTEDGSPRFDFYCNARKKIISHIRNQIIEHPQRFQGELIRE